MLMKKLICILLIMALALPLAAATPVFAATEPLDDFPGGDSGSSNDPSEEHKEPVDPVAYADVNGDGSFNAQDVVCVLRYLVGHTDESVSAEAADFNRDGRVNARDVLEMMLAIVNGEA